VKILLVHNTYQQAGGEDVVFEQERRLLEDHGNLVVTYTRSNHELEAFRLLQRLSIAQRMISSGDSKREIAAVLRIEKPDLVHVHNTFLMISPSVYEACREARVPVLQTLHNYRLCCPAASLFRDGHICNECGERGLWRGIRHGCYRDSHAMTAAVALMLQVHRMRRTWDDSVTAFLALTNFARQKYVEAGLPAEKIHVKPNFVAPDPGERDTPGSYALFAGRLSPEKGVASLVAAWECLRSPIPLLVVGDGPLRAKLETECANRGLRQVTFKGQLSLNETRQVIKHAAFLIVPSIWYETFSLNIAEAFACGTPVICSNLGAMRENVADHRTGLHFAPGDVADMAEKVEWAWDHPRELAAMGREARRVYEIRYTPQENYSQLMRIYNQTVAAHARIA
jgi:glycosyltransferase involved in cell wall biosynthesis